MKKPLHSFRRREIYRCTVQMCFLDTEMTKNKDNCSFYYYNNKSLKCKRYYNVEGFNGRFIFYYS